MRTPNQIIHLIQRHLTPDLLKPEYQRRLTSRTRPFYGHCYVATESLYYLLGGPASEWTPTYVHHEGSTHWFLVHQRTGEILDVTAAQFHRPPPYQHGLGCGFQKYPSDRTRTLLARLALR
jgi:hypothetical protein